MIEYVSPSFLTIPELETQSHLSSLINRCFHYWGLMAAMIYCCYDPQQAVLA